MRFALLVLSTLVIGHAAPAVADDALPSAREVVDRYIEATGAEVLEGQVSRKIVGTFSVPAQGLSGNLTVYAMPPNKAYTEIELTGMGTIRQGYDGEHAWSMDPFQGPQLMTGAAAEQQAMQSNWFSPLYREEDVESMEITGKTTFEGEEAYELDITRKGGVRAKEYFSVESGLMLGTVMEVETPMGAIPTRVIFGDYEELGDMKVPTKTTMSSAGMQQVMIFDEVSTEEFDTSVFELPAAVKALTESE